MIVDLFAPHTAEEMWEMLGYVPFVGLATWRQADPTLLVEDSVTAVVQIDGKVRGTLTVPARISADNLEALARKRWLTDPAMMDLSGDAFATHVRGLMYGVEHESDGLIPAKALRLLLPDGAEAFRVTAELVEAGLWGLGETGFQIVAWSETQTTRTEMERTRKQNAERQRRHRAAKRG